MAPKDVYFLNPRTGEYVTLHGKKGFCRCESVKDLEMRRSHEDLIMSYPDGSSAIPGSL